MRKKLRTPVPVVASTFRFRPKVLARLQRLSLKMEVSQQWIVNMAVLQYLRRHRKSGPRRQGGAGQLSLLPKD